MPEAVSTSNIVLFESSDGEVRLDVASDRETVWLSQQQMASLFGTTKQNISLHVNNCFKEGELQKETVVKDFLTTAKDGKRYNTAHYNLDVIISVGYRVKSQRGVEFRRWATDVLRRYIMEGRAENEKRLAQLNCLPFLGQEKWEASLCQEGRFTMRGFDGVPQSSTRKGTGAT